MKKTLYTTLIILPVLIIVFFISVPLKSLGELSFFIARFLRTVLVETYKRAPKRD